jgi:hypothetical protein
MDFVKSIENFALIHVSKKGMNAAGNMNAAGDCNPGNIYN